MKRRIGVLFGGRSAERDVSLMSARSIMAHLDPERYDVYPIAITPQGAWLFGPDAREALARGTLEDLTPALIPPDPTKAGLWLWKDHVLEHLTQLDVVFPVLHGPWGEDGTVQGLLELAGIPYVGAGVTASALAMDKGLFKDVMRAHGLPVVPYRVFTRAQWRRSPEAVLDASEALGPYPLFTKPANLGSSIGITKAKHRAQLRAGLDEAARYDRRLLVEVGIPAREIEVSILGNDDPQASIPGEIVPADEFYTYQAKYFDDRSQLLIPAPLPPHLAQRARELALAAYQAIDARGMARVDFLLHRETGELYISEINTIPGFTPISMYPKLWEASGLSYPALLDRLIELALEDR
ncbi:MAG: D-alanine--D-alanine ligase [Chloroflexi bacterium]|nr:D-alanine--D-alanine ligase [Chloroflexota bacterium]